MQARALIGVRGHRSALRRLKCLGGALRIAALVPVAVLGGAVPALAADPPIQVEYQGTIDETKTLGGTPNAWSFHVQWDFVWGLHPPLAAPSWAIKTLTGTVSAVLPPPNQSTSCSGTLSDDPYLPILSAQYTPGFESGAGKQNTVQVNGNAPRVLHSSSPQTPFGFCGNARNEITWDGPYPQPNPDPSQAQLDYVLGSGTRTQDFNETWNASDQTNEHLVLVSKLVVNGSLQPLPATPQAVRDAALNALRAAVAQAYYPCLTAAAGVVLFTGGPIGVLLGGTLTAVAAPACAGVIALLANLQKTYRDPPLRSYTTAARVVRLPPPHIRFPHCARHGTRPNATCQRLQQAALAWVIEVQRTQESSLALATTIGRETAARNAHNTKAETLQRQTALRLLATLHHDLRNQTTAGTALASLLRRIGASGQLTLAQATRAISETLRRLARDGIPAAPLRAEAPHQLAATPLNLLTILTQPLG
jgi:hypothetical protein